MGLMSYSDPVKQREAQHSSYLRNKTRYIVNQRQTRAKWQKRVWLQKMKPCMDCEIVYPPYVMDFDHRPGEVKIADINRLVRQSNWKTIEEEILKCDLVCANCHRIRTYNRSKSGGMVYTEDLKSSALA